MQNICITADNISIILGSLLGFIAFIVQEAIRNYRENNRVAVAAYAKNGISKIIYKKKTKSNRT